MEWVGNCWLRVKSALITRGTKSTAVVIIIIMVTINNNRKWSKLHLIVIIFISKLELTLKLIEHVIMAIQIYVIKLSSRFILITYINYSLINWLMVAMNWLFSEWAGKQTENVIYKIINCTSKSYTPDYMSIDLKLW